MMNRIRQMGLLALLVLAAAAPQAGQERYDYDALGRLIRYINPAGEATEYVYDAVGNVLEVRRGEVNPPRITGVAPDIVRHNTKVPVVVTGTDLLGATVTAADPGLRISSLRSSSTEVTFDLLPDESVPLGVQPFTLASSTGSAGFSLTVKEQLPQIVVMPPQLILAPGEFAELRVSLSHPDDEGGLLILNIADPSIASLSSGTLDFAAGTTELRLTVTALARGYSWIELGAAELAPVRCGVQVPEDEPPGARARFAETVGVVRTPAPVYRSSGPYVAARVGVTREHSVASRPLGPFMAPPVGVVRE